MPQGGGGGKAVDQREHVPIARSPDAEPGACVAWVGACASTTPDTRGRSRMREIRSYGSVRGVPGNRHSYRNYVAKFGFWRPNAKFGYQKINDLQVSTFLFAVICDRAISYTPR